LPFSSAALAEAMLEVDRERDSAAEKGIFGASLAQKYRYDRVAARLLAVLAEFKLV
jgi:hypothetical protein